MVSDASRYLCLISLAGSPAFPDSSSPADMTTGAMPNFLNAKLHWNVFPCPFPPQIPTLRKARLGKHYLKQNWKGSLLNLPKDLGADMPEMSYRNILIMIRLLLTLILPCPSWAVSACLEILGALSNLSRKIQYSDSDLNTPCVKSTDKRIAIMADQCLLFSKLILARQYTSNGLLLQNSPRMSGTLILGKSKKFLATWMEILSKNPGEM